MNKDLKENPPKPSQIFTLARAVRPNQKNSGVLSTKPRNLFSNKQISMQIKEVINLRNENIERRQPRSHLPMNMIVSKMATRKPLLNNEDQCSQDLSMYRHFKLAPPPWQNKLKRNKHRSSASQKIIQKMKEKCAEFDSSQSDESIIFKHSRPSEVASLVSDVTPEANDRLTTPRLNFNYNQLYGVRENSVKRKPPILIEGEDPLEFDNNEGQMTETDNDDFIQRCFSAHESAVQVKQDGESTEQLEEELEFVWNPVLVSNRPIREPSPVFESMSDQVMTDSDEFDLSLPTTLTDPGYTTTYNPPAFDTSSSGYWETSSTSSDHTIAEETLQLTYVTVQGGASSNICKYLKKQPTMSWPILEPTRHSGTSWLDCQPPFFNFREE